MTLQEIFDKSVRACILQGRPAFNLYSGACKYEARDGSRCAVGHLLDDAQIKEYGDVEGDVGALVQREMPRTPLPEYFDDEGVLRFLTRLQLAHDQTESVRRSPDLWLKRFVGACELLAAEYRLGTAVIAEALAERASRAT